MDLLDLARPLELARRPAGDRLAVLLRPSGLRAVATPNGGFGLQDETNTERLHLSLPTVRDAHGTQGSVSLALSGSSATLHFDPVYLASAAYPLTLQPAVERRDQVLVTAPGIRIANSRPAFSSTSRAVPAGGQGPLPWGAIWFGMLGDGTTTDRSVPTVVANLSAVVALAAGGYHSLALTPDGTVWTWGANWDGELGRATSQSCFDGSVPVPCGTSPQPIRGLSQIVSIAAGGYHSLALRQDGTVWAWGGNWNGQLGDGSTTNRVVPVQVQGLQGVASVAAGRYFSLALKTDGTLWTWGANESGELGLGNYTDALRPTQVQGLSGGLRAIAAGEYFALAMRSDSHILSWGDNAYGQLGHGDASLTQNTPSLVSTLSKVTQIGAGGYHSLAETQDGTLWSWGANWDGELGATSREDCVVDGVDNSCSTSPLAVSGPPAIRGATSLKGAAWHSLVLGADGTIWGWGGNWHGELGNGTTNGGTTPVEAAGLSQMSVIAAGREHNLAATGVTK